MRNRLHKMCIFALMQSKKITIHDIASQLNMSASTVSRALSGNKRISKETRDRVQNTANDLNYKPNHLASSFRTGRSKTIGIIIPRINRHFFSHAIAGMERVTNPAGYNLMICQTNENFDEEKKSIQTLINNRVDGIIMSVSVGTKNAAHVKAALAAGIQVVQFDRVSEGVNIDKVLNNNLEGGYQATMHLIGQGYRNIVHAAGPLHNNVYADRCAGYRKAMQEAGLHVTENRVIEVELTRDGGRNLIEKLADQNQLPEAIFSASDYSALGMFIELKNRGFSIPKDIALVGFANEPFTEFIEPGLTTLEQHGVEMGRSAAKLLIERLDGEHQIAVPRVVTINPELIVRGSSLKA